ncbi:MAG: radical SAM protein, partial [Bacteroidaceae bacterium]|nr:radical SAM protein [Bacteroidaceae bacterium]
QTQCYYSKNCNGCWINFHRKYDIILLRNMERLLPKRFIEKFYGPYQWTDNPCTTYRKYFKTL